MGDSGVVLMICAGIGVVVVVRLLLGKFDAGRIEEYARSNGWELLERNWDPFGPGWLGEKDSRLYQILYRDKTGKLHRASVKTSMLSGVYLTNDRVVEHTPVSEFIIQPVSDEPDKTALEAENERLRQRIAELERGLE